MRRALGLLGGIVLLGACISESNDTAAPATTEPITSATVMPGEGALGPAVQKDLAALRVATAKFQRFESRTSGGYTEQPQPPGCFVASNPAEGAMGYHYMDPTRIGTLDVTEPQLLIYEPEKNGQMKLVGVEYIFPGNPTDTPPRLFDQDFVYNTEFSVWTLHAWVWRQNPSGIFNSWNTKVSCAYATDLHRVAAHHVSPK